MPIPLTLQGTLAGRDLEAAALARGRAEGAQAGRAHGAKQAIIAILQQRFGADPRIPSAADALAHLPLERAVARALAGAALEELLDPAG